LRDSPSLRREIDAAIVEQAKIAAELAAADLSQRGEPVEPVWRRLEKGGFTADEVLEDWFPQPPG
jgi:hypothetical protein